VLAANVTKRFGASIARAVEHGRDGQASAAAEPRAASGTDPDADPGTAGTVPGTDRPAAETDPGAGSPTAAETDPGAGSPTAAETDPGERA
jgi:hypothetical protein